MKVMSSLYFAFLSVYLLSGSVNAAPWTYDFRQGLDPHFWTTAIIGNTAFTYTQTQSGIRVAGPSGGSGFQAGRIMLNLNNYPLGLTNFEATASFTNAVFTAGDAHQVEFQFTFGSQFIAVSKDYNDFHLYRDPPRINENFVATSATSGKVRIVRSGSSINAYLNGSDQPFWSATGYGTEPLVYMAMAIQKNSTSVATEVTWTDFSITPAPGSNPVITTCGLSNGTVSLGWTGTAQVPVIVERATSLSIGDWKGVSSNNTDRAFTDTAAPTDRGFYRVKAPVD